ncbi:phosphatidylserine/phosphatidylglycerophosphate/cardiolipin synthase-like enzyme [Motilibacter rhizosphaerae]|uniref:Phosphatidylserine/phosphatidylglycerophosphate/ cardiolipin synthase-like enzyme n=1 Tax=Motilibacter rhizosphaerae TaxID=598652 RepID=A0A4Q7NA53_9ACTN|nr:phospholipase D-like domain-containing protein [Motilibacter rhizosphaerae]RZS79003.1 phosphatidylserine/phosphatidylglycerophosphate/cardiolipin synthase-like enzyme [Motilibacter rhizosphaerae]
MAPDPAPGRWFLSADERGNPATRIDRRHPDGLAWTTGNEVRPLVHGATYFRRLHDELDALVPGDRLWFTDWRGDADQRLLPDGPTIGELLCTLATRGVEVRGLLWRSHSDRATFSAQENQRLGQELNEAGGEVLLDQRVRRFGSHHQKVVVVQHRGAPERDVAFVGGIDLCHGRRDDAEHGADPQQQPMDKRYEGRSPWHDAALELRGPVVGDVLQTFVERWDDHRPLDRRTPYRMAVQRAARMPRHPEPLPEQLPSPPAAGAHAVQVLRTYGRKHRGFPFAPLGERSVARAYLKAFSLARKLVYIEDQYLWSPLVADALAGALRREPGLRVIAVVPRFPDSDGFFTGPPNRIGQLEAIRRLRAAAPDRVGVFDLENTAGTPIYVHAKVCVVDDIWMTCGSDNLNRRSWTCDSEATCAVVDPERDAREPRDPAGTAEGARVLPRSLRAELWAEHLALPADDERLLDLDGALDLWRQRSGALDDWHGSSRRGARPPGQARAHRPDPVRAWQRVWAEPLYRVLYDPDGRPLRMRLARTL